MTPFDTTELRTTVLYILCLEVLKNLYFNCSNWLGGIKKMIRNSPIEFECAEKSFHASLASKDFQKVLKHALIID